jgi:hypothetical protein
MLKEVFDEWSCPTTALSVLLDRRAMCMDQHVIINPISKAAYKNEIRVYFVGLRQWSMVWSINPHDQQFRPRGVIMCLDKTWASSVPGVVLQYFKTMWMFLDYQGIFPLVACMASLRYASSALAEDDKEALQREYELRSWLKGGFTTERKNLGYTSAQVSWLSSRVSRHRDRLMVVNRMLAILKDTLDIYEVYAKNDRFEILRTCICNLADMKEHLRAQVRQLEAQANVQLAVLFNLITPKDSGAAMMIARTSQCIAADSRRDQKVSVDIANSSRIIAYNTLRDSASMKAIANVTMVFLPGTFLASVFAMPFFSSQKGISFFVNSKIWIYVAITIPLTIVTLVSAWLWRYYSTRSHHLVQEVDIEPGRLQSTTGQVMTGKPLWSDVMPVQDSGLSSEEKDIEQGAYDRGEGRIDDLFQLDTNSDQQEWNHNDFEHWDPMTREFAPSVFAASSFAFTEDSGAESAAGGGVAVKNASVAATKGSDTATEESATSAKESNSTKGSRRVYVEDNTSSDDPIRVTTISPSATRRALDRTQRSATLLPSRVDRPGDAPKRHFSRHEANDVEDEWVRARKREADKAAADYMPSSTRRPSPKSRHRRDSPEMPPIVYRSNTQPTVYTSTTPPNIYSSATPPTVYRSNTPPAVYRSNTPPAVYRTSTPPAVLKVIHRQPSIEVIQRQPSIEVIHHQLSTELLHPRRSPSEVVMIISRVGTGADRGARLEVMEVMVVENTKLEAEDITAMRQCDVLQHIEQTLLFDEPGYLTALPINYDGTNDGRKGRSDE